MKIIILTVIVSILVGGFLGLAFRAYDKGKNIEVFQAIDSSVASHENTMPKENKDYNSEVSEANNPYVYKDLDRDMAEYYDKNDILIVNTPQELANLADLFGTEDAYYAERDFNGKTVKLGADIDMTGIAFKGFIEDVKFKGIFDGDNKSIIGIKITDSKFNTAFIGFLSPDGVVTNLHIEGRIEGQDNSSGIVGVNYGKIEKVSFKGEVIGRSHVGGLVGTNRGTIDNSSNEASVTGSGEFVGGITGWNAEKITGSYNSGKLQGYEYIGGIAGINYQESFIEKSYNLGNIGVNENHGNIDNTNVGSITGGLVGENQGDIINSYNHGAINSGGISIGGIAGHNFGHINNSYNAGDIKGGDRNVGGIAGEISDGRDSGVWIMNSYNSGSVRAAYKVGGIVGYMSSGRDRCFIINSYNTGSIEGTVNMIGGIAGEIWYYANPKATEKLDPTSIINVYNIGSVNNYAATYTNIGGIAGVTSSLNIAKNAYFLMSKYINTGRLPIANYMIKGIGDDFREDTVEAIGINGFKAKMFNEKYFRGLSIKYDNPWIDKTFKGAAVINGVSKRPVLKGVGEGKGL